MLCDLCFCRTIVIHNFNAYIIFSFKKKGGKHDNPRMPLHSGEPRAQHAPRGPDGCLLLSPRSPPHPITPLTDAAEPISPSHQDSSTSLWWMRTHACTQAHTNAHWITLTTNFTRTTYDIYAHFWRGYPICMLFFIIRVCVVWGSGETKKGAILNPPRMKPQPMLSSLARPDILASKLS